MPASVQRWSWCRGALALAVGLGFAALSAGAEAQPAEKVPVKAKAAPANAKAPKAAKPAAAKKVDVAAQRALLDGADADLAVGAADELGRSGGDDAHDALLDALATGLAPAPAAAALTALGKHPGKSDVATLAFYSRYRDPAVRAAAAGALGGHDEKLAVKALIGALSDDDPRVRTAAAGAAATGKVKSAAKPLLALLVKGDEPAGKALAALADVELARLIGEQLGVVSDGLLAMTLGAILMRSDFGPDSARLEVVRALGKIAGAEATSALADYVSATPEKPPRQSRGEAESMVEARLGGE